MKRCFDIALAGIGLLLCAPLFVTIALWIKVDSRGPIFFRQARVGWKGELFRIHKFRTMAVTQPNDALSITVGADPRVTRSGSVLRAYKLDELPQLLDVLLGKMSIVGPRPEVPEYMALYPPGVREQVLSVRPGMTDLASIEFRNENELLAAASNPVKAYVEDILPIKQSYYLQYVKTHDLLLDIKIVLRTIMVVISG